jgi:hypothetical protein
MAVPVSNRVFAGINHFWKFGTVSALLPGTAGKPASLTERKGKYASGTDTL